MPRVARPKRSAGRVELSRGKILQDKRILKKNSGFILGFSTGIRLAK
jgi:hypothetical protein